MGDYFSSIVAIMMFGFVVFFPISAFVFLLKKRKSLKKKKIKNKFGILYEETNYKKTSASLYHVIFFARRLVIAVMLVFLDSYAFG